MEKMKYVVTVRYMNFIFDDRGEALDFADTAFVHVDEPSAVSIKLVHEEEEE